MKNKPFFWLGGLLLALVILLRGPGGIAAQTPDLFINEILVGNATTNIETDFYEYASWIEIYNGRATSVDLKEYSLSYDEDGFVLDWTVPGTVNVPAGGRVLLYVDEQDAGTHASFKMDMRGDTITLLDPSGTVVDSVDYDMRDGSTLLADVSYGRATDGGGALVYFDQPTPAGPNTTPGFPILVHRRSAGLLAARRLLQHGPDRHPLHHGKQRRDPLHQGWLDAHGRFPNMTGRFSVRRRWSSAPACSRRTSWTAKPMARTPI